jgi:hypothetical protein
VAFALVAHLVLAAALVRRGPASPGTGPAEPPLSVVFVVPRPQIVLPSPPPPEPVTAPPWTEAPQPAPAPEPAAGAAEPAPPRPPDLVFVLDSPDDANPAEPRVAGAAGVTLPEVAPESAEEARRIQQTPRAGWVVLRVLVRRDGTVQEVVPEGGGDAEAARRMAPAVRELRFRPALQRGRPVDAWFTLVWPPG